MPQLQFGGPIGPFFDNVQRRGVPCTVQGTFEYAQPMDVKMALRMNEHNNGYMSMGRYAVWTSDVNVNDKPDLSKDVEAGLKKCCEEFFASI